MGDSSVMIIYWIIMHDYVIIQDHLPDVVVVSFIRANRFCNNLIQ